MNGTPLVAVIAGFVELAVSAAAHGSAYAAVSFTEQEPYSSTNPQDSDGWVDVRGFTRATVIATPSGQAADYKLLAKRSSDDPNPVTVATFTLVAAGTTQEMLAGSCENYSHVKLEHKYNTTSGGSTRASILLK